MRKLLALALLAFALPAAAEASWSSLWRNADQRGEALLQHGDAAAAAKVYSDPMSKAYAELKAGDYAAAARDLAPIDDVDADYNRGNALAHSGDLQGAIRAYDAALKRDPHNRDARHNRELVAKALKQQAQQQGSSGNQAQDKKNGNSQGSSSPNQDKQGDQARQNANGKNGRQAQSASGNPGQTGQSKNHAGADQHPSAQGASGKTSAQQEQLRQKEQGNTATARQATPDSQTDNRSDAEQAKRDATASLAKATPGKPGSTGTGEAAGDNSAQPLATPLSEKQLAQEQWLRSIPDDPGGLLRRKFLIEHLMRQQKTQP